ncbi:Integral membrane protein [Penicillium expansum]|nr:Integral membrane protein [Penicillium expansum]
MSLTTRLPFLFLALIALTISALAADSILPTSASSTFPQCGLTCTALTGAQTSCESAAASTWTSCFCQSSLLTGLKTSGSICSTCSTTDQATLSTWYNNYCNSGGKDTSNTATTATTSAGTASTSVSSSSSSTNKSATTTEENKSWWSTHYRWVIMLIVLVIGFTIIAVLGVRFKRRYDAKRPNLYHGGGSSLLSTASPPAPRDAAWGGAAPVPVQTPGLTADSLASSSRSTMVKASTPVPGSRTRLTKIEQGSGDVEVRQV